MTYITIFGFDYEGDHAETICLHAEMSEADARGVAWQGDKYPTFDHDYMKIMEPADGGGYNEIKRFERG